MTWLRKPWLSRSLGCCSTRRCAHLRLAQASCSSSSRPSRRSSTRFCGAEDARYISFYPQYLTILTPVLALVAGRLGTSELRGVALILLVLASCRHERSRSSRR